MSAKELIVRGLGTRLRVISLPSGFVRLEVEQDGVGNSLSMALDRDGQHLLMLYLQERFGK